MRFTVCLSQLGPFAFAFPDAKAERQRELVPKPLMQKLADVLYGRVIEKFVPGSVVEARQYFPEVPLQIGEIHDHSVANVAIDDEFDPVGVTMYRSAFWMVWEEVCTVNVLDNADSHAARGE